MCPPLLGCEDPHRHTIQLHSQHSVTTLMLQYVKSWTNCHSPSAKNLFLSVKWRGFTAHSWTRQQAGVSGEQNTAVVVSVVGFMSQHCGCGRVMEAAMRKLVSCPQHCHCHMSHGLTMGTLLTFVSYRVLEAGSVLYCSLMEHVLGRKFFLFKSMECF